TKTFGAALDVMNAKFGGQAAAASQTYAGQLKSLTIAADEAKETIGFALLKAVGDVSDAFGGTSGASDMISGFSQATANLVTSVGAMATEIAKLTTTLAANKDEGTDWGDRLQTWGHALDVINPVFSNLIDTMVLATDVGEALTVVEQAKADAIAATSALYAGYKANSDRAHSATIALTESSDALAEAQKGIKDSFLEVTAAMSQQASMDSWRKALLGIKDALDKTSTSLDVQSLAGLNNRDAVRTMFSDSQKAAEDWGIKYNKTQDEVEAKTASMYAKNRAALIAAGLKAADVDKYLGGLGLWDARIKALASGLTMGQAAAGMRYAGMAMGKDLSQGVADGITAASPAVNAASARLIKQAEAYARAAAESHSPSQLFYRIGEDLGEGLTLGLEVVWPR
ncbi:hypothetical protein JZU48_05465, partial [bacterium]|nr:hypothetical protein [bacterium]